MPSWGNCPGSRECSPALQHSAVSCTYSKDVRCRNHAALVPRDSLPSQRALKLSQRHITMRATVRTHTDYTPWQINDTRQQWYGPEARCKARAKSWLWYRGKATATLPEGDRPHALRLMAELIASPLEANPTARTTPPDRAQHRSSNSPTISEG